MRVSYGPWEPDKQTLENQLIATTALNMRCRSAGYVPATGLSPISGASVLDERPRGAVSGLDATGSGFLYAGTGPVAAPASSGKLWVQKDAGMVDISQAGGYALGATHRWSMVEFNGRVFAGTLNAPMQQHLIGSPLNFEDVPDYAPRARHLAVVGDFLFAGNIYDQLSGTMPDTISWSAIGDGLLWPQFGTDDAVQVQSDRQRLPGGGWVQDIVSGAEVGAVFQETAIHRFDYIGGYGIFERNRIESGNGMLIPYSAAPFGRMIFYIAEDGFRLFDLTQTIPVGKARVSNTFLADLDTQYMDRVETAKDPDDTVVWTIYPGSGNVGGRPNKVIWYDYVLDKFTHGEIDLEGLIHRASDTALSIDAPAAAGDPDDVDDTADPDAEDSYDNRLQSSGNSRMGCWDTTFLASDFTGDPLESIYETGDLELNQGVRSFVSGVRPLVTGERAEVAVAGRSTLDEDIVFGPYVGMDLDGTVPMRSDARYHRFRIRMPAGWTEALGVDVQGAPAGNR